MENVQTKQKILPEQFIDAQEDLKVNWLSGSDVIYIPLTDVELLLERYAALVENTKEIDNSTIENETGNQEEMEEEDENGSEEEVPSKLHFYHWQHDPVIIAEVNSEVERIIRELTENCSKGIRETEIVVDSKLESAIMKKVWQKVQRMDFDYKALKSEYRLPWPGARYGRNYNTYSEEKDGKTRIVLVYKWHVSVP